MHVIKIDLIKLMVPLLHQFLIRPAPQSQDHSQATGFGYNAGANIESMSVVGINYFKESNDCKNLSP